MNLFLPIIPPFHQFMSIQSLKNPLQLMLLLWIMIMCLSTVNFTDTLQQEVPINVCHPLSLQSISCIHALNAVHLLLQEIQTMINEDSLCRGLSNTDSNPITEEDRAQYDSSKRDAQD